METQTEELKINFESRIDFTNLKDKLDSLRSIFYMSLLYTYTCQNHQILRLDFIHRISGQYSFIGIIEESICSRIWSVPTLPM